jgi:hypothetical protein
MEEHRLMVSEKSVPRRIFGPKREEVARGWKKLHNEETHNLCASSNITGVVKSSRMKWAGHVACMGGMRNVYNILIGKPEGRKPFGKPRRRREDNIRLDLREIWREGVDWMHLTQDRDQWRACEHGKEPSGSRKGGEFLD